MKVGPLLTHFQRVLKTCDDLLRFVAHSGHRANHRTDDRFESVIEALSTYAIGFHPGSLHTAYHDTLSSLTFS